MTQVLVVYTTSLGNTQTMASAIADGVRSVEHIDIDLEIKVAADVVVDDVRRCNTLIVGTPIRHRTADSRIKKVIEDTLEKLWLTDDMVGKVGGVPSINAVQDGYSVQAVMDASGSPS